MNFRTHFICANAESILSRILFFFQSIRKSVKNQQLLAADEQTKISVTPIPSRETQFESLKSEEFDVLVIGGGATGAGCALDAVSRGMYSPQRI